MAVDAKLGRASVAIRATLDQLDGDLSQARGRVDTAVGRMVKGAGKSFQTLGKAALGGIGVATGAVTGLTAALGKVAIDAAPVEGIQDAFAGLAESAGTSQDEMLAALERGSSGMISQRDLMMSFNKAAQLVSKDFATQLPDAMQYLSKVSAATGEDMSFMMDSLVTGVGRMSPMILDNLGIQVSLAEATEAAADKFGLQADELTDAQKQAGLMNVVLEKLAENTASMPDVSESAAAKMAKMRATIQNTKDQIGQAFLPVLATLMTLFGELADRLLPPVIDALEGIAPVIQNVVEQIMYFILAVAEGEDPLAMLQEMLAHLFPEDTANQIMTIVTGIVTFLGTVQEALAPVLAWIRRNVELKDVLIAIGAAIASVIIPVLGTIVSAVAPVIAVFVAVTAIVAALRSAWESNFLGIRDKTQAVINFVRNIIQGALNAIQGWWAAHGASVQTIVSGFLTGIQTIIQTVLNVIRSIWQTYGETMLAVARNTWNSIKTVVETIIGNIGDVIDAVAALIRGDWETFGQEMQSIWERSWEAIQTILGNAWDSIQRIIGDIIDSIIRFFTETDWKSIGQDIIDGIKSGIQNKAKALVDAAVQAARDAVEAVKKWLGISSPSQVFIDIGLSMAEGIIVGIRGKNDDVQDAVEDMLAAVREIGSLGFIDPFEQQASDLKREIDAITRQLEDTDDRIERNRLLAERNRLTREYEGMMERITAFEEARAQQEFLSQQMELLDLIKKYELDPESILGGLELGLDADRMGLVDAMTRAMQAIVQAANDELQISSPSMRFIEIGEYMMEGLVQGMEEGARRLQGLVGRTAEGLTAWTDRALIPPNELGGLGRSGGTRQVVIYGLTIEGVESREGLLAELQALT